jgi:hypothetical protein
MQMDKLLVREKRFNAVVDTAIQKEGPEEANMFGFVIKVHTIMSPSPTLSMNRISVTTAEFAYFDSSSSGLSSNGEDSRDGVELACVIIFILMRPNTCHGPFSSARS